MLNLPSTIIKSECGARSLFSSSRHIGQRAAIWITGACLLVELAGQAFGQAPVIAQPGQAPPPLPPAPLVTVTTAAGSSSSSAPLAPPSGVSAPAGYQLSANDQVAVEVFGEDDLRTVSRLNGEGNLALPLLGSVHLAGLSLTQATARVTELYGRDYLVSPRVNLTLVSYAKRRFTILGQVNRPGSYEMPESSAGSIDLLEAVAMAGGYTRTAAPSRVSVRRAARGGGEQVLRVDAKKLENGQGGRGSSFRVEAGDTITVGESIF